MARVTEAEVTAIIDTDLTSAQVQAFIDDASGWIDDNLADAGLFDATLKRIEKYLAAHFITLRDPRIRSGTIGDVSETYQRDTQVTEYLKAAAGMDPTGIIGDRLMGGRPRAHFRVGAGYDGRRDLPRAST